MNQNGRVKHGLHGTLTYQRWKSMRQRTSLTGRGHHHSVYYKNVTCCERWSKFDAFLSDMGECPHGYTLDRINNAHGYEPGNCRWATISEQNANRSSCIMITRDGITKTATEWARSLGLRPTTVIERLRRGFSHEEALLPTKLTKKRSP